ncbi:MAG: cyclic pyranopterin monophosphate synthase MoaC [Tepidisphaeraceae bacterium]
MSNLTHFDEDGRPRMVDVSAKPVTARIAVARGRVSMEPATLQRVMDGGAAKGDVIAVAELAGIMAAKRTGDLIPLCHPLGLDAVNMRIAPDPSLPGLAVIAEVRSTGRTGIEMEAMTAVSVACLTIYDMLKAVDRAMLIEAIELVEKSGGKSGDWRRP